MSRTDIDPATLAKALRGMAGDGSIEWVRGPIQASVLLDVADALDENDRLREEVHWLKKGDILHVLTDQEYIDQDKHEREMQVSIDALDKENAELRELCGDMLRWMPCPRPCSRCERYEYPNGCEFERRRRELGIEVGEC